MSRTATVQIQPPQAQKTNKVLQARKQEEDSDAVDSDTPVYRARDVDLIMDQTAINFEQLKNDFVKEKRSGIAKDRIIKETVDKLKGKELEVKMMNQELDHFRNKRRNIDTSITDHKLNKLFNIKNNMLEEEANKGVDDEYQRIKKQYGL